MQMISKQHALGRGSVEYMRLSDSSLSVPRKQRLMVMERHQKRERDRGQEERNLRDALRNIVLPVISLSACQQDESSPTQLEDSEQGHGLNTCGLVRDHEYSSKTIGSQVSSVETDRLQVTPQVQTYHTQRRESFLYRSDSDCDIQPPPKSASRHSSISSDGVRAEELVTPFAQVLSCLHNVRSSFVLLTNVRQNRFRRGSDGFHLNSRLCQLHETGDGSLMRDDMFKKLVMETLKEFDWCLDQLEGLKASMTISEMASNKFKKLLDRELKESSDGLGGKEISEWVYNTFIEKQFEPDVSTPKSKEPSIRARSMSLVKSIRKLTRSMSCSGIVPRFGVECDDESALEKCMEDVDKWHFDVFKLNEVTSGRPLVAVTYTILQTRDLLKTFRIKPSTFVSYIALVENHYLKDVPFHNCVHAADVTQSTHVLLAASAFQSVFSDIETLAAIIASAVHDVDHPGVNNQFLVNSNSEMALIYNDESVLENHHLAVAFQLMQHENCDIFENLSKKERQMIRKMIIEMVLATDNAKHMGLLASLKTMVETKKIAGSKQLVLDSVADRMHILKCLVHCADLSNPTRPLHLYQKWVNRLMEEFFRQGDLEREKKIDISPMMDRHNANVEKSQVVFIDYVIHPLWETWADLVYPDAQQILSTLEKNREWYKAHSDPSPSGTPGNGTPHQTPKSSPYLNRMRKISLQMSRKSCPLALRGETESESVSPGRRKSDTDTLGSSQQKSLQEVRRRLLKFVDVMASPDNVNEEEEEVPLTGNGMIGNPKPLWINQSTVESSVATSAREKPTDKNQNLSTQGVRDTSS